jgi:hypothetical protein
MTQEHGQDIDLLLASLRADATDAHAFMQALAARLDGALPEQINIERQGGLFAREKKVKRIELELGDHRYSIVEEGHGRLRAQRVRIVRGVALKTEDLPVESWLADVANDLKQLADTSSRAREALERLLLG